MPAGGPVRRKEPGPSAWPGRSLGTHLRAAWFKNRLSVRELCTQSYGNHRFDGFRIGVTFASAERAVSLILVPVNNLKKRGFSRDP